MLETEPGLQSYYYNKNTSNNNSNLILELRTFVFVRITVVIRQIIQAISIFCWNNWWYILDVTKSSGFNKMVKVFLFATQLITFKYLSSVIR